MPLENEHRIRPSQEKAKKRNPTTDILNLLAAKYIVGELDESFISFKKEKRAAFLRKAAGELEIEANPSDIEGLAEISDAESIEDYLRKAFEKYPENEPPDFYIPSEFLT